MCGRYSLFTPRGDLEARFDAAFEGFEPRYNAAPGQSLPVVTDADPDRARWLEWGLVPRWADSASDSHINARAETVADKPAFAEAYERRRCLVPADGFYEWVDNENESGTQPCRVAYDDDRPFAMAGLWERWTPETRQAGLGDFGDGASEPTDCGPIETFTVITTEPNEVVEPLHHRMAVILGPEEEDEWLAGGDVPLDPAPPSGLRSYPVSTAVNSPANDDPELIRPLE